MPSQHVFDPEDARKFTQANGWFRDEKGRYALFRGVNFGPRSKISPYLPIYPLEEKVFSAETLRKELGRAQGMLRQLKDLGFNVVRLVVQWKALAPEPTTVANRTYLDAVKVIVQELFALGIYSLVDFHQDIASELYGGDGFPDWAIANPPSPPVALRPCTAWQMRYGPVSWPLRLSCEVRKTLRSFWKDRTRNGANVYHTQDMLIESMSAAAKAFKRLPGVLGYELFNEPDPVGFGERQFEQDYLGPFYVKAINRISAEDDKAFLFVEPRVDWTVFKKPSQVETFLPVSFPGNRTVFSFHYYDSWTALLADAFKLSDRMSGKADLWSALFERTLGAAHQRGLVPFLSEYGCDYDGKHAWQAPAKVGARSYPRQSTAYTDVSLQLIEKRLLNSTMWSFDLYATEKHNDNWNNEDSSLLDWRRRIHDPEIVARPYPTRSSAEPTLLYFDSLSKIGVSRFKGAPVTSAPTIFYVPDSIQYPDGFEIHCTSGRVAWDGANHFVSWKPDMRHDEHLLVVCPVGELDRGALPPESRRLLARAKMCFQTGRRGATPRRK